MKRKFVILLGLVPCLAKAQDRAYTVSGTIGGSENYGVLFARYTPSTGPHKDTAFVKGSAFAFAGTVNEERQKGQVIVYSEPQKSTLFYLEPGNIVISCPKGAEHFRVGGTPLNEELQEYNTALYQLLDSLNKNRKERKITEFDPEIQAARLELTKQFIRQHPSSPVGVDEMELTEKLKRKS